MGDGVADLADVLRLVHQGLFVEAAEQLSGVAERADSAAVLVLIDAAREMCRAGAAHRAAAEEMESAAEQQRTSERQIQARLTTLLSDGGEHDPPPEGTRRSGIRHLWRRARGEPPPRPAPRPGLASRFFDLRTTSPPSSTAGQAAPRLHGRWPSPSAPTEDMGEPDHVAPPEADVVARTLGNLEVVVMGRAVREWGSVKGRGVLQYLLLSGGAPVRREILMDLLWPDHSPGSARNNLNVALYALRRARVPERRWDGPLHRAPSGLLHAGTLRLVVDRPGRLQRGLVERVRRLWTERRHGGADGLPTAIALCRGRLFEDDPTGEWFFAEQRLIEERCLVALERLAALQMAEGDVEAAEASLQRAVTMDPCRESAHRLLMQCYADLHQQQSVTRQFRLCVDALGSELGIQPDPETVRVFHTLMGNSR